MTASVWHRPVVAEEIKDRLAERQARAAVALVRHGQSGGGLAPAAAQCRPPAAELHRQLAESPGCRSESDRRRTRPAGFSPRPPSGRDGRRPGEGFATDESMDAILFHPETSLRRALDPGAGNLRHGGFSPGEREPLTGKLLDLYRNDPDAGIHGAAEWTLRQWKQQEKLKDLDAELMQAQGLGRAAVVRQRPGADVRRDRGPGRVPHGLAADRAGTCRRETTSSPSDDDPPPVRHRRQGGHGRAIPAVREASRITIPRYQSPASFLNKYSPDPDGPWIGPDWYTAAHYCNWLSEQEGLPQGPVVLPAQRGRGLTPRG